MSENIEEIAREYAIKCHSQTNHMYDDKPYSHHLNMVVDIAKAFKHFIPEKDQLTVFAGCWTHDVPEDTRETFNNVKQAVNQEVAELAYALTNEKGKNRAERANYKYYYGIRQTKYATFIKLCDRMANVTYSMEAGGKSGMFEKYKKENKEFIDKLIQPDKFILWNYFLKWFMGKETYRLYLINRNPYNGMIGLLEIMCK
jgi:(p)ppGpp synthase/HD superfamily hydrolase